MPDAPAPMAWGQHTLTWGGHTYLMGILNITPDSFSGDGLIAADAPSAQVIERAVAQARQMVADGAELLDIGGESTRPSTVGAEPLSAEIELQRVIPVIEQLAAVLPSTVILSIDTYKAAVAEAALNAGAALINDITGLHGDPEMAALAASRQAPIVLMSNLRGQPRHDPLADVTRQLARSVQLALDAGIAWDHLILDPGFGFGLAGVENLRVLARLAELRALGRPLLVGTSRKSHIGLVLGTPADDRLEGTAATVALSIAYGADIVRVHDVRQMARVARMADAVVRGWTPEPAP
ncbi:MAG TPA: dihydropteroate synthase [Ktedonobacterales bacterium]|nr:dihydropteroate synthase [Ktedonobacterales bacterium]